MIVLGLILLVVGVILSIYILTAIGIILLIVGAVLFVAGNSGHQLGSRRHYY